MNPSETRLNQALTRDKEIKRQDGFTLDGVKARLRRRPWTKPKHLEEQVSEHTVTGIKGFMPRCEQKTDLNVTSTFDSFNTTFNKTFSKTNELLCQLF